MDQYKNLILEIKNKTLNEILKELLTRTKEDFLFKEILNLGLFPKFLSDLHNFPLIEKGNNIEGELSFLVFSVISNNLKIEKFLFFEKEFQRNILNEHYDKCIEILNDCKDELGYSDWWLENMFALEQKINGSEGNWNLLKKLNESSKNNYAQFFYYVYSKKVEPETSVYHFFKEIETITHVAENGLRDYINIKLNNSNYKYSDILGIVNNESSSSLIDKYLTLIKVLNEILYINDLQNLAKDVLSLLIEKINDKRLIRLTELLPNYTKKINDFNKDLLRIFNTYSVGNYEKSIQLSLDFLKRDPSEFSIYEIIIKSLLIMNKKNDFLELNNLTNYILKNLYNLLKRDEDYYTCKENLLKQSLSFSSLNFFNQLETFVLSTTQKITRQETLTKYISYSNYCNPQVILFSLKNKKKSFPKESISKNISLLINQLIFDNKIQEINELKIPEEKKFLYQLRSKVLNNSLDFSASINIKSHFGNSFIDMHTLEELIIYNFRILIFQNKISDAKDLIVNYYLVNKYLVERIQIDAVANKIIEMNYEIDNVNLNLPILFHIAGMDYYFQYAALDQFLDVENVDLPSSLSEEKYEKTKFIFLLYQVCNIEVLSNFYFKFNSEEEIIQERVKILNKLKKINPSCFESYDDEINFINYRHKIKKTLRNINDGKITLNHNLSDETNKSYEGIYNRLIKLNEFSVKYDLNSLDIHQMASKYLEEIKNDSSLLAQASFVSFKSLFFEIIEDYLFSKKYGLDFILSTRFRHGVIENHLRSIFNNNNLISVKNKEDKYTDIEYWNGYKMFGVDEESLLILQNILKDFSLKIDNYINFIVKEQIQIYTNRYTEKENALFYYKFTNEYLWLLYKDTLGLNLSYKLFLEYINELVFKKTTQTLLNNIASFFINNINKEFQNLIKDLENNIGESFSNKKHELFKDLNKSLSNTKAFIEKELHQISKWFKINNSTDSILDGETIINVTMDNYPFQIDYEIENKLSIAFEGSYFYIDIIRILVDNSLKYSNLSHSEVHIKFLLSNNSIKYIDKDKKEAERTGVDIKIQNSFKKDSLNIDEINFKLNQVKKNWSQDLNLVNREGGSGFQKIEKILKYDLKVINSSMDFSINDKNLEITIHYEI